jgi:hypothetical protein
MMLQEKIYEENYSEYSSPTEQLGLFSDENNQYTESIKQSIEEILNKDNLIFQNKDTELYLLESNKKWNTVDGIIVCKITDSNNLESFFQLKINIDLLKKYIYCEYKWKKAKNILWMKVNIPFMVHLQEFIWKIIDVDNDELLLYKYATKKPQDIIKKQLKNKEIEFPELNIKSRKIEEAADWKYNFYFSVDNYEFRILNILISSQKQNNWNNDENSELYTFNSNILHNIWVKIKGNWSRFSNKNEKIDSYTRKEISKFLFNTLNWIEFKKIKESI